MRLGKIFVFLLTALFLSLSVFFGIEESRWDGTVELSVTIRSDGKSEEIRCQEGHPESFLLVLPGYADLSQATFHTNTSASVRIQEQPVTDSLTCDEFPLGVPLTLSYEGEDGPHDFALTIMQSDNTAAMFVDVASGGMHYIHERKGNKEPGTLRLYTEDGLLDHAGNLDAIEGRGNSTWLTMKKPYNLSLSNAGDLLGMGSAHNWVLLTNRYDPTYVRNKIVYDSASSIGLPYAPESRFVDLYLNRKYVGLYQLCEKIEVHPQRLDISYDRSFLVSMELEERMIDQGYPYIRTDAGTVLRIRHNTIGQEAIADIWQSAENAILSPEGIDPDTGKHWTELIDLDSWVRNFLVEEIFGNVDACLSSQYFYYDQAGSGKIHAGPVWDYDVSMGNTQWQIAPSHSLTASRPHIWRQDDAPLFYALYQKTEFRNRLVERYRQEFLPLLTQLLDTGIDAYTAPLLPAIRANQTLWPYNQIQGEYQDTALHIENMKTYMHERMAFLNSLWLENEDYCFVQVDIGEGFIQGCYAIRPGDTFPLLPPFEREASAVFLGWYDQQTHAPFDITQPIYEDKQIYAKFAPIQSPSPSDPVVPPGSDSPTMPMPDGQ